MSKKDIVERLRAGYDDPERALKNVAADEIERLRKQVDKYGLALMMIAEGSSNPSAFARETLAVKMTTMEHIAKDIREGRFPLKSDD
jgi:ketol-acid reductoisomerase